MPHPADVRTHATHDLERIAAYAAGDASGPDLELAAALVAGCAQCSAVHHDLRLIAAALPAMPAPRRTRDFRISPEQVAALRPTGWRALLGTFAGPRFRLAAPLGTGLATLGLAGLLIGTLAGTPLGVGGGTRTDIDTGRPYAGANPPAATPAPSLQERVTVQRAASPSPSAAAGTGSLLGPVAGPTASGTPPEPAEPIAKDVSAAAGEPGVAAIVLASVAAVVIGAALVVGRVLGRRLVRAP